MTSPPGWYPDPDGKGGIRYFDGTWWTKHRVTPSPTPRPDMITDKPNRWTTRTKVLACGGAVAALLVAAAAILGNGGEKDPTPHQRARRALPPPP